MKILTPAEVRAHEALSWDEHKLFHVKYRGRRVTMFETGECSVTTGGGRVTKDVTGIRSSLNAGLLSTADMGWLHEQINGAPLLTPEGERLTAAGLNLTMGGRPNCQHLWVDMDHRMIVGFERARQNKAIADWPDHIRRRGGIYYTAPTAKPRGATVSYTTTRTYTAEEKAHLRELTAACKVWAKLRELYMPETHGDWIPIADREMLQKALDVKSRFGSWTQQPSHLCTYLDKSFADVSPKDRWYLAVGGLKKTRVERKLPYLTW